MNILHIHPRPGQGVYVFEFPVRIWHWTMAACVFVLFITGHFIGKPLHTLSGDTTNLFYLGYTIMAHYIAAFILIIGMVCRIIWAFFGNAVSRQIFLPRVWDRAWWSDLLSDIKWYLFLTKEPRVHMGHNPLAQLGMGVCVLAIVLMCLTGLGIYQSKTSSSFFHLFRFVQDFAYWTGGNVIDLVVWHRVGMVILVAFVIIHLYMVIREEIVGRTTLISTMVSGFRLVRADSNDKGQVTQQQEDFLRIHYDSGSDAERHRPRVGQHFMRR